MVNGPLAMLCLVFVFVVCWGMFLGKYVNTTGAYFVQETGAQGMEAFIMSNLNLFIFLGFVLGITAYLYFGGG